MAEADPLLETLDLAEAAGHGAYERVLEDGVGTAAVVAPPFAGRAAVLDRAATRLNSERRDLDPGAEPPEPPVEADENALVVDGCHHLFDRRVGGFDRLRSFRRTVARADGAVVTGWNSHAWSYLRHAVDLEATLDVVFDLPPAHPGALENYVREATDGSVEVVPGSEEAPEFLRRGTTTLGVAGRDLEVPYLLPDPGAVAALRGDREDPEAAAFERLAGVADGNPGVALAIWRRVAENGTVAPGDVGPPVDPPDLTDPETFLLRLVLANGRLAPDRLGPIADLELASALRRLTRAGLIDRDGDLATIRPEAVPAATTITERRRLR